MAKFVIDEAFLSQLERLQTLLKNNVGGMFGGNRKSKTFGSSCEFADHREYLPGDDITKIDWNIYARTEKLYQKLYLDERQMHTRIYIDASKSMDHGTGKKAEQALKVAAAIAYMSVGEMDKVSVYAVRDNQIYEVMKGVVGKDNYLTAVNAFNEIEFDGEICFSEAILPTSVGMGDGLSILISDFLTDNDFERAIHHLADKKRDVVCVQILSREELNPQARGKMHFFDSEIASRTYRKHIDREIIKAYKMALEYVTERVRKCCAVRGMDYVLLNDEEDLTKVFFGSLVDMGVLK
jgi:uncharacterized protein (DUF58 family)